MEKKNFMSSDVVVIVPACLDELSACKKVLALSFAMQVKVSQLMGVIATVKKDCGNIFAPVHLNISHIIINGE